MAFIGFDVYGTLVDPLGMDAPLREHVGDLAERFAATWRERQIDWTFRRALMGRYVDFDVVTRDAFRITSAMLGVDSGMAEAGLLDDYRRLPAFADAAEGLVRLAEAGHRLVAFSNGVGATLRGLLTHARLMPPLDDVVSVDEVRTYKPSPPCTSTWSPAAGKAPTARGSSRRTRGTCSARSRPASGRRGSGARRACTGTAVASPSRIWWSRRSPSCPSARSDGAGLTGGPRRGLRDGAGRAARVPARIPHPGGVLATGARWTMKESESAAVIATLNEILELELAGRRSVLALLADDLRACPHPNRLVDARARPRRRWTTPWPPVST